MAKNSSKSVAVSLFILIFLIVMQGLSGILGGLGLIIDPSGESLHIPVEWLEGSPFNDYFIPGLILLVVLGLYPLIVFIGLLMKKKWSWFNSLLVGVFLLIWIGVEVLIIGYQPKPPLQLIYGLFGILILIFVFLRSVRRHLI